MKRQDNKSTCWRQGRNTNMNMGIARKSLVLGVIVLMIGAGIVINNTSVKADPGTVTVYGYACYDNETGINKFLKFAKVQLWDNMGIKGITQTDEYGYFEFDPVENSDEYGTLDLSVKIVLDNDAVWITPGLLISDYTYYWETSRAWDVPDGYISISMDGSYVTPTMISGIIFGGEVSENRAAAFIFDKLTDAYIWLKSMNDKTGYDLDGDGYSNGDSWDQPRIKIEWPKDDSYFIPEWQLTRPNEGGYHIHLKYERRWNVDTIQHEYSHAVMWKLYNGHYPAGSPIEDHFPIGISNEHTALVEGWAEFLPNIIQRNDCYRWGDNSVIYVETDNQYQKNRENYPRELPFQGNRIEGAVLNILYDISDDSSFDDLYTGVDDDGIPGEFDKVWNILRDYQPDAMVDYSSSDNDFWDAWFDAGYEYQTEMQTIFLEFGIPVYTIYPYVINDGPAQNLILYIDGEYVTSEFANEHSPTPHIFSSIIVQAGYHDIEVIGNDYGAVLREDIYCIQNDQYEWIGELEYPGPDESAIIKITNNNYFDGEPSLFQKASGTYYLTWSSLSSGNLDVWLYQSSDAINWVNKKQVTTYSGTDHHPSFTEASNGNFLISYVSTQGYPWGDKTYLSQSTDNGNTWSTPTLGEPYCSGNPYLFKDSSGTIYFLRHQIGSKTKVSKSTDNGNTWTLISAIQNHPYVLNPEMRQYDGNLFLACDSYQDINPNPPDIYFYQSTNGGYTWIEKSKIDASNHDSAPTFVKTKAGQYIAVWVSNNRDSSGKNHLYYSTSNNFISWTFPQLLPVFTLYNNLWPCLLKDKNGKIFLAWSSDKDGDYEIYLAKFSDLIDTYENSANHMIISGLCPIDLLVTDPEGNTISKTNSEILDAVYIEKDMNSDGELENIIFNPNAIDGPYDITVIPEPGADPSDTFSIKVYHKGENYYITQNVKISEISSDPYVYFVGDIIPPTTTKTVSEPKHGQNDLSVTSLTEFNLTATDDLAGVRSTFYRIWCDGEWTSWMEYLENFSLLSEGLHYLEYYSVDNGFNPEVIHNQTHFVDDTSPTITIETPSSWEALQDGVTFQSVVTDSCGLDWVKYAIREPGGAQGTIIDPIYESLVASSASEDKWQLFFDTTQFDDGYYVLFVNASDNLGNIGFTTVNFSIRNWAVFQMLPNTPNSKAGRTIPVKFSLRVAAAVDPTQPFVRNEELTIKIYVKGYPGTILQTSTYGISSTDYRINSVEEQYITNFKTLSTPKTYKVDIWRDTLFIGSFEFATVK